MMLKYGVHTHHLTSHTNDTGLTIGQVKLFLSLYGNDDAMLSETPENHRGGGGGGG